MKIENWERIDHSRHKIEWKHDTGVRIILMREYNRYILRLYDSSGIEHYTTENTNRSLLEAEAAKWQRQYNKHLTKENKKEKYRLFA